MCTRFSELLLKDVVCLQNGKCLGKVCDVDIDLKECKIVSIVIFGRLKCFGLLGRENDISIKWDDIELIGEDTILIKKNAYNTVPPKKKKRRLF